MACVDTTMGFAGEEIFQQMSPLYHERSTNNKVDHPGTSEETEPKRRTTKRARNAKSNSINNKRDHNRSNGQSTHNRVIIKRTWDPSYADKNKEVPDKKASKADVINRDITVSSTDEIKVTVKRIAEVSSEYQHNLTDLRDRLHRVRKERETTHGISNPSKDCDWRRKGSKTSPERLSGGNQNAGPSAKKGIQTEFSEEMRSSELTSRPTSFTKRDGKHQTAGKEHNGLSENSEVTKSLVDEINKYSSQFQISPDPEEKDSLDLVTDTGYVSQYNYEFSHHPIHKSHWSVEETEGITNTLRGNENSFRESHQCPAAEEPTIKLAEGSCQKQSRKRKAPSTDDWAIQAPPAKRARLMMSSDVTDLWSRKGDSPISFDHTVIASRTSDDLTDGKRASRKRKAPSDENWVTEASPAKRARLMSAV